MINTWKRDILRLEKEHGNRHTDERRAFNHFLSGGSNSHFDLLLEAARLEGGGWFDGWFTTKGSLYKAFLAMESWKKLTLRAGDFCKQMETCLRNGRKFPKDTWDSLTESFSKICSNKDILAALENRQETQDLMNVLKKDAKASSSKLGFFRRVWNWIKTNKGTVFAITTLLFIAYLALI